MAKASLVEADIEAGRSLVKALDEARFRVQAALWLYLSEPGEWRLLVASPEVDERGPKKAYTHLQSVLAKPSVRLSLKDVSLVSPHYDLIRLLSRAISTGPGISGIRFTANTVDNVFIEDAYIYRLQ
jgi:hypothetical protein